MLNICRDCLTAPPAPNRYYTIRGILIENPAYSDWKIAENERIEKLKEEK